MKKSDIFVLTAVVLCLLPFFFCECVLDGYMQVNASHPYVMAFIKFAVLATFGEMLALRIKSGIYYKSDFGVFPKMIVWGFLGIWIAFAMKVFAVGVPIIVEKIGADGLTAAMSQGFSAWKLLGAFLLQYIDFVVDYLNKIW